MSVENVDNLYQTIKELEAEIKQLYMDVAMLSSEQARESQRLRNLIKYKEAKVEERKKFLKSYKPASYHSC